MRFPSIAFPRTAAAAVAAGLILATGVPALAEGADATDVASAMSSAINTQAAGEEITAAQAPEGAAYAATAVELPSAEDAGTDQAVEGPVATEAAETATLSGPANEADAANAEEATVATPAEPDDTSTAASEVAAAAADNVAETQASENGLVTEGDATYYYIDGQRVTGQVYDASTSGWYYFDETTGAMVRGWKAIASQGKTVYYDPVTGKMTYGESEVTTEDAAQGRTAGWYLFDGVTGAVRESSMEFMEQGRRWVYFTEHGRRAEGELYLNDDEGHNGWYYFDASNSGAMVHGFWESDNGYTVYYDAVTGIMHHGEAYLQDASGDGWRYFDAATGEMARGFKHLSEGDKTVHYDETNGVMDHGEAYLASVSNPGWYHFDEYTGSMTTGWKDLSGKRVYYDANGVMAHGWLVLSGSTYYTDPLTGALVTGERYVDTDGEGHVAGWYHFNDTNATLDKGWKYLTAAKKWVYYDPETGGAMAHENFTQDGVTYLVDAQTGAISNATVVPIRKAMQWMCDIAADARYGYDWSYRWGERGDYDCSSLVISALRYAGFNTGSASYTGDMRSNLTANGFRWITDVSQRQAGDILLNETYHTAMYLGNEWLVQASGNENGGVYGGQPGDQTGREIYERNYYTYTHGGWDGLLRYVG